MRKILGMLQKMKTKMMQMRMRARLISLLTLFLALWWEYLKKKIQANSEKRIFLPNSSENFPIKTDQSRQRKNAGEDQPEPVYVESDEK